MRPLNRITPKLPAIVMKTYSIDAPQSTHFRRASCAEMACPNFVRGWCVAVPPDAMGQQIDYAVQHSGKTFRKLTVDEAEIAQPGVNFAGSLYVYFFAPGQECFDGEAGRHQTRIDRPEIFSVRGGDWRAQTTPPRRHTRAADWVDDFADHQDRLATALQHG